MKLIIDIPEKMYHMINAGFYDYGDMNVIIQNGIPLPKGHGRLIDADAFERRCMFDSDIEDMQDVIYALRDYKSTIEADKAERGDE